MSKNQPSRPYQATKKLNPVSPSLDPRPSGYRCRDKIESNLQSQMYVERSPDLEESPHHRDQKINPSQPVVNRIFAIFSLLPTPFRKQARLRYSRAAKIFFECRRKRKVARCSTNENGRVARTKCGRNPARVPVITRAVENFGTKSR